MLTKQKGNKGKPVFIANLLVDAADAGHQPANAALARLIAFDPDFSPLAPQIQGNLARHGFHWVRNKDNKTELEFWARKVPETFAELEALAKAIEQQGSIGKDYFLCDPGSKKAVVKLLRAEAQALRQRGEQQIEQLLLVLRDHAKEGRVEEVQKLTQELLALGTETYTNPLKLKTLVAKMGKLNDIAGEIQAVLKEAKETGVHPDKLKTTGHERTPKSPRLAGASSSGQSTGRFYSQSAAQARLQARNRGKASTPGKLQQLRGGLTGKK